MYEFKACPDGHAVLLFRVAVLNVLAGQTRVSDLKGLTVVNQRKWVFMYERLVKEVR